MSGDENNTEPRSIEDAAALPWILVCFSLSFIGALTLLLSLWREEDINSSRKRILLTLGLCDAAWSFFGICYYFILSVDPGDTPLEYSTVNSAIKPLSIIAIFFITSSLFWTSVMAWHATQVNTSRKQDPEEGFYFLLQNADDTQSWELDMENRYHCIVWPIAICNAVIFACTFVYPKATWLNKSIGHIIFGAFDALVVLFLLHTIISSYLRRYKNTKAQQTQMLSANGGAPTSLGSQTKSFTRSVTSSYTDSSDNFTDLNRIHFFIFWDILAVSNFLWYFIYLASGNKPTATIAVIGLGPLNSLGLLNAMSWGSLGQVSQRCCVTFCRRTAFAERNEMRMLNLHSGQFLIEFDHLRLDKIIGSGVSSVVHKGEYAGAQVAIKEMTATLMTPDKISRVQTEISVLAKLQHPFVVRLYGVSIHNSKVFLITECCVSDLSAFTYNTERDDWPDSKKHAACIQIAVGMKFLHTNNVIHRDLKPPNVLLDHALNCKLTDFGLSKAAFTPEMSLTGAATGLIGTPPFMAPELIVADPRALGEYSYNAKVDVYAYGMTILSLWSRMEPFGSFQGPVYKLLQNVAEKDLRPEIPGCMPKEISQLILQCWSKNPDQRPSFDAICTYFESSYKAQQIIMPGSGRTESAEVSDGFFSIQGENAEPIRMFGGNHTLNDGVFNTPPSSFPPSNARVWFADSQNARTDDDRAPSNQSDFKTT